MFLVDLFYGVLASLGLWQKEAKILFLGLDDVEKTTLLHCLHMMKDDNAEEITLFARLVQHQPTQYPTMEELSIGNIKFKVIDYGGPQITRRVVGDYHVQVDAVVYVVDASNPRRLVESMRELHASLSDDSLANVPFLILGNLFHLDLLVGLRRDLPLEDFFQYRDEFFLYRDEFANLDDFNVNPLEADPNVRPVRVFRYGIDCKEVCREGFRWLSQYIN